jgi:sulfite reductase (NADPH) flavoprotein alpha-component
MEKHATELFTWLRSGSHIYVCGAKEPMSTDVENTLLSIISREGNQNAAQAESFLNELKESGRYIKDVY